MTPPDNTPVEARLRDYGQLLDHYIDTTPTANVEPVRTRPLRGLLSIAAAVAIVALGSVVVAAFLDRVAVTTTGPADSIPADESDTSTLAQATEIEPEPVTGIEPAPDPEGFAGVERCTSGIEEVRREGGLAFPAPFDPRTATEEVVVLPLPASPAAVQVLLIGPGGFYDCTAARDGEVIYDHGHARLDPFQDLEASEIEPVDNQWSSSTADGATGPGTVRTIGRVGDDVEAVWILLGDGVTKIPAIVTDDRWFTVDGRIPQDVPLFDETYYWRLRDGSVRSAPLDDFDEATTEERCAATPGCVERRIAEIQAEAQTRGLDEQSSALADGSITETELREASRNVVECLNEAGVQATLTSDGSGYSTQSQLGDDPNDAIAAQQTCNESYWNLVVQVHVLQRAEADLTDGE